MNSILKGYWSPNLAPSPLNVYFLLSSVNTLKPYIMFISVYLSDTNTATIFHLNA